MMDHLHNQINTIESNPIIGTRLTILSAGTGFLINLVKDGHINPLIMDVLQAGAWGTAIGVGLFTMISYVKKWIKKE